MIGSIPKIEGGRELPVDVKSLLGVHELADYFAEMRMEGTDLTGMSDAEVVRTVLLSGECDSLAVVLHRLTGWPIRGLSDRENGFIHRFVEAPDGRFLDASGWTTLDVMKRRYGVKKPVLSNQGGEELAVGFLDSGDDESEYPEVRSYGPLHTAAAAILVLPDNPFPDLAQLLTRDLVPAP